MKHRRREGSKNKDKISSRKLTTEFFWFFSVQKYRYGDDEKRVKKKYEKKIKSKREREKMRSNKKKTVHKNGDGEKKLRKHEIEKREKEKHWDREIKKEWRKEREEKRVRKAKRDEQKDERKSEQRKQWWKKQGTCWKMKKQQKRDGTQTKNEDFLGWFFLWFKVKGEQDFKKQK